LFISQRTVGDLGVEQPSLLHQTGTALSHLRPSGMAMIGGRRVDVVTEGAMIDKGTPVRVVALEGLRVVVRAVPSSQFSQSAPTQSQNR
jgi:membrane-bound ClpP family serine protease